MQVKGVRLYAKDDIRLEEFELPEITSFALANLASSMSVTITLAGLFSMARA